jgi:glucosamine-6-phosphate deaminase
VYQDVRTVVVADGQEVGRAGARFVARHLRRHPKTVLGLATGTTTISFYEELVRLHGKDGLDFSGVVTFNLDEYYGVGPDDPRSYHWFMQQHFFRFVNLNPANAHLPDGRADCVETECRRYEEAIAASGGVDLQVLGIGINGHIGFNEPGTPLGTTTQLVRLRPETVHRNEGLTGATSPLPEVAISVGLRTIMNARRLLLMASGASKAAAVRAALEGPVVGEVPASILQLHPDLKVILDLAAAEMLSHAKAVDLG